jgi:LuxR family transcriptional regulator, transcriptional regulator of spore coat protein
MDEPLNLTPDDVRLVNLLAAGCSAKTIARNLDSDARTIERQVAKLRVKLRARNRSHLVALVGLAAVASPNEVAA